MFFTITIEFIVKYIYIYTPSSKQSTLTQGHLELSSGQVFTTWKLNKQNCLNLVMVRNRSNSTPVLISHSKK